MTAPATPAGASAASGASGAAAGRVLVVDDVEANRELLARRLRRMGHDVVVAVDGLDALARLAERETDLVLLDVMMPQLDGYDTLARIKQDPVLRHVPVLMVSAVDELSSVVRCIELGADDYLPKPFDPVLLRARVTASLEKKRLRDVERRWAASMERELEIGRQIQGNFFPEALPAAAGWELAAAFASARQVAGDFYDAFVLADGRHVALVVGDVCDKGVGAALFMALFRTLVRAAAGEAGADPLGADPADGPAARVLRAVRVTNDYIARVHGSANMFATLFVAALDPATGALTYVNAGHDPPLVLDGAGVRARLAPTGPAAGLLPDVPFTVATASLAPGESLLVYTDGVTEARRGDDTLFGEDALERAALSAPAGAAPLLAHVRAALAAHVDGAEASDDVTMLAVYREAALGARP
jgi:serine phosphatase RsbU (regulator of sigma subunit)